MKIYYNRAYMGISLLIALLFMGALFTRCASVSTPSGGPRDTLPPVIISMNPENFTTNMDTMVRKIVIEFDEFVTLNDQQTEFFTSPQMKNKPQLQVRGRGVVITLRDTLKTNTTYALNFGSTIRDNNEGNALFSARYVFSTGDSIDSMILSGYAEDSYKADSVGGTFVMFYPADSISLNPEYDSTLFNATPAVIARAEKNGIFLAQNLKPIPYHVYALEDTNGNLTYEPGTDRVGFIDGVKNPAELEEFAIWFDSLRKYVVAEPQIHFRMFTDKPFQRQLLSDHQRPSQHKAILSFGANYPQIDSIILDSIPSDRIMIEHMTKGRDTLALWFNMPSEQLPDTIRGRVVYFKHDSLNQLTRTSDKLALSWRYIETKEMEQNRLKLEREKKKAEEDGVEWIAPEEPNPFNVNRSTTREVNPEKTLIFDFDYPLAKLDTTAITLQYLSPKAVELRAELAQSSSEEGGDGANPTTTLRGTAIPYKFRRDTQNIRRWHLTTNWGEVGSEYFLTIPQGAMVDIAGFANDSIAQEYTPLDPEQFATLIVNLKEDVETPSKYVIDLLNVAGSALIERKTDVSPGKVVFNYVPAGEVMLRLIQDKNGNGVWDSGDLINRIQPEKSQTFKQNDEEKIATKINWEIEIEVDPALLFAPEDQAQLAARLEKEERLRLEKLYGEKTKK